MLIYVDSSEITKGYIAEKGSESVDAPDSPSVRRLVVDDEERDDLVVGDGEVKVQVERVREVILGVVTVELAPDEDAAVVVHHLRGLHGDVGRDELPGTERLDRSLAPELSAVVVHEGVVRERRHQPRE